MSLQCNNYKTILSISVAHDHVIVEPLRVKDLINILRMQRYNCQIAWEIEPIGRGVNPGDGGATHKDFGQRDRGVVNGS